MFASLTLLTAFATAAPVIKDKEPPLGKGPGYMGIMFSSACGGGFQLSEVKSGGPAEKSGLKEDDILLKANDTDLTNMDTSKFVEMIGAMRPGMTVKLEVRRGTEIHTIKVKLAPRPADFDKLIQRPDPFDDRP